MKRALLWVLLAAAVVIAVRPRSRGGPRTGEWHGSTTQGLPIQFQVVDTDDGLAIEAWRVRVDVRCETTGRTIHGLVFGGVPVPLRDSRFIVEIAHIGLWHRLLGSFSESTARGQVESVWPALTGTVRAKLGSEKCSVPELGWTARHGGAAAGSADVAPDVTIVAGPGGSILVSTRSSGYR